MCSTGLDLSWKPSSSPPASSPWPKWATRPSCSSLVLAARFRKPWPIVLGILVATLANHALAGAAGAWVTTLLGPEVLRWVLGGSFIAMALWMLIPDKLDEDGGGKAPRLGVFGTTVMAFFLAEMGDKTQVATVMLAAQYARLGRRWWPAPPWA